MMRRPGFGYAEERTSSSEAQVIRPLIAYWLEWANWAGQCRKNKFRPSILLTKESATQIYQKKLRKKKDGCAKKKGTKRNKGKTKMNQK